MTYREIPIPDDLVDQVIEYREKLVEAAAEFDDSLMEKFFEDPNSITIPELRAGVRQAVMSMSITPILCGSAFKNKGVQACLDAVCYYMPSPLDVDAIIGTNPDTDKEVTRNPTVSEPFSALAFKIATDPFVGRLCFIRVYSVQT